MVDIENKEIQWMFTWNKCPIYRHVRMGIRKISVNVVEFNMYECGFNKQGEKKVYSLTFLSAPTHQERAPLPISGELH